MGRRVVRARKGGIKKLSYDVYKNRICIEAADGRVLPLILVADSSLIDENGRMSRCWGVASFTFIKPNPQGLLYDGDEYIKGVREGVPEIVKKENWKNMERKKRHPGSMWDTNLTMDSSMGVANALMVQFQPINSIWDTW